MPDTVSVSPSRACRSDTSSSGTFGAPAAARAGPAAAIGLSTDEVDRRQRQHHDNRADDRDQPCDSTADSVEADWNSAARPAPCALQRAVVARGWNACRNGRGASAQRIACRPLARRGSGAVRTGGARDWHRRVFAGAARAVLCRAGCRPAAAAYAMARGAARACGDVPDFLRQAPSRARSSARARRE